MGNSLDFYRTTPAKWHQEVQQAKPTKNGSGELSYRLAFTAFNIPSGDNYVFSLPKELFKAPFTNLLLALSANTCQLSGISEKIGSLRNLTTLTLRKNQISVLPKELSLCENLETLDLSYNQFTSFPLQFPMISLRVCRLNQNQITSFTQKLEPLAPTSIIRHYFPSLDHLDLSRNKITQLDWSIILEMPSLVHLNLSRNQLQKIILPTNNKSKTDMSYLIRLKRLNLKNNLLTSDIDYSAILSQDMSELQDLLLSNNKLTSFPDAVLQLKGLVCLSMHHNEITSLPNQIHTLKNIKNLDLSDNPIDSIGTLRTKNRLRGALNTDIPDEIIPNFLFLGSAGASRNLKFLKQHNIKNILVVCYDISTPFFPEEGFKYKFVAAADALDYDISQDFKECLDFIVDAEEKGEAVIVHCVKGKSRSASVVIAYLMKTKGWNYERALKQVSRQRPMISPNPFFIQKLKEFESTLVTPLAHSAPN